MQGVGEAKERGCEPEEGSRDKTCGWDVKGKRACMKESESRTVLRSGRNERTGQMRSYCWWTIRRPEKAKEGR